MKKSQFIHLFLFSTILIFSTSCVRYVFQAAVGQFQIILDNVAIEKVVKEPDKFKLSESDITKLQDILKVKKFAENELKLTASDNYSNFKKLDRKYVAYQVTAARALELKAYTWYFPIVGRVAYIGYFSREDQKREGAKLMEQGYDVRFQNIIAYSTLGWFDDPLLSSMLLLSRDHLINTIIHEMAHSTIYFSGDTDFNESVASFLGDEGTRLYLKKTFGKEIPMLKKVMDERFDEAVFSKHVKKCLNELKSIYALKIKNKEKLKRKAESIARCQTGLEKKKGAFRTKRYDYFYSPKFKPNNAHFLSYRRYFLDQSLFYKGYRLLGSDYIKYLSFLKGLSQKGSKDFKEILRKELQKIESKRESRNN